MAGTGTRSGTASGAGTEDGAEGRSRWWGFLGRLAAALLARWVLVLVILVALGLLVTKIAEQVWPFTVEDGINRGFESGRTPEGNDVSFWMSAGGNTSTIVPLCLLAFVALRVTLERWREAIFVASVTLGQSIVFVLTTMLIDRPRPDVEHLDESPPTSSFPSGHTSAAIAFYTSLAIVAHRRIVNPWTRRVVMAVLICLPVAVAIGRLYRGMHHPSDVTASVVNAGLLLLLTDRLLRSRPMPDDGAVPAHGVPRPRTAQSGEALTSEGLSAGPGAVAVPAEARRPGRPVERDSGPRQGKVALVVNPVKVDDVDALAGRLRDRCAAEGLDEPLVLTTTAEDPGRGQAREAIAAGAILVVAAGGDGTVRAVAEGLAGSGVPLAVLPQGTGNLLARNLELPLDLDDALDAAMDGEDRAIDVGRLDDSDGDGEGTVFAVMAGVGFDAAMMQEAPEGLKSAVGWPAYIVGGARGMRRGAMRVEVSLDGAPPIRARVRTVLVANLGKLQGGLELAPDASPDDGLLDVVLVSPSKAYHWVMLLVRGVSGRSRSDQRLRMFQASSVHIRVHHSQPRQVDGDLIEDGVTLVARVEPGALVVRFPVSGDGPAPDAVGEALTVAARP